MHSVQLLRTIWKIGFVQFAGCIWYDQNDVDDNTESSDTLDAEENVAEQEVLCVLQMQEMEWMFLDDIEYDNIEDVPVVKDPEVRTPLFDPTTENVDDARDS